MQVLLLLAKNGILVELFFQEVLDGFDVMVGRLLDFFDTFCIFEGELCEDAIHKVLLLGYLRDDGVVGGDELLGEQCLEPAQLDVNSESHQSELREVWSQGVARSCISSIDRTDGSQGRDRRYLLGRCAE